MVLESSFPDAGRCPTPSPHGNGWTSGLKIWRKEGFHVQFVQFLKTAEHLYAGAIGSAETLREQNR